MAVLKAIGAFFVRIGRWIKETAWVQPLLIVGGIFGIIFAIPYLTKWVGSWTSESDAHEYYDNKKLSLEGSKTQSSEADNLFKAIEEGNVSSYGEKFFVLFLEEDCAACDERYGGFKTLEDNWKKSGEFKLDEEFKLYTIYADEEDDNGNGYFEDFYENLASKGFWDDTIGSMQSSSDPVHYYAQHTTSYDTNLDNLNDEDKMATPILFLFDFTEEGGAYANWMSGWHVREVLFSFERSGKTDDDFYAYARTLHYAWVNDSSKDNVFSKDYAA